MVAATFGLENGGRLPHAVPLREAVGRCAASVLVDGERFDPVRLHNEATLGSLFEALATSGGETSSFGWRAKALDAVLRHEMSGDVTAKAEAKADLEKNVFFREAVTPKRLVLRVGAQVMNAVYLAIADKAIIWNEEVQIPINDLCEEAGAARRRGYTLYTSDTPAPEYEFQ